MTHLHVDAALAAAGDMLLAALVDAGADPSVVRAAIAAVAGDAVAVTVTPVRRGGLRALSVVIEPEAEPPHRTWSDVRTMLTESDLAEPVRAASLATFAALAEAEGRVHGVDPDSVHFHEVGALDAIADVVGVCAAVADLAVASVSCTPVGVGSGLAATAHGVVPVPVPAVVELLRGVPTAAGPLPFEACTPTAAALLRVHVDAWGGQPPMRVAAVGVGAGSREADGVANVVRVFVGSALDAPGEDASPADSAADPATWEADPGPAGRRPLLIETNIDDMDPRLWPGVLDALLAAGAADAWLTPILMKKGRPAHTLAVLVAADKAAQVRRLIFEQTTSIGLRESTFDKVALSRQIVDVLVRGHRVGVKLARDTDGIVRNVQPEWEDVRRVADAVGMPTKEILRMAVAAAVDEAAGWADDR